MSRAIQIAGALGYEYVGMHLHFPKGARGCLVCIRITDTTAVWRYERDAPVLSQAEYEYEFGTLQALGWIPGRAVPCQK